MKIISIPSLEDNYIWILYNENKKCIIVDPGEVDPVIRILKKYHLIPTVIILTHHHQDHVGGVEELRKYFSIPVYGPKETEKKGANKIVSEGIHIMLLNSNFRVIELPGHTLGHIGFYSEPWFFCGDTIFSAGCGKIIEGTAQKMYSSIQKINNLPPNTLICSAHEYTLNNINFAYSLFPEDKVIINYKIKIKQLRNKNIPTLPTMLSLERKINPFLRINEITLHRALNIHPFSGENWSILSLLRKKKDDFNKVI